jgi:hypothetical protein
MEAVSVCLHFVTSNKGWPIFTSLNRKPEIIMRIAYLEFLSVI